MRIAIFLAFIPFLAAFDTQLINVESGRLVVEFMEGNVQFFDPFMEEEMRETGIYIPPESLADFEDKKVVYLGDPLFEKAFIEIYYPLCIANPLYQWQN